MTIRSIPVPHFVQWSMKGNDSETFLPININAGEYRGTSNSFPNPVLVIKHIGRLQNCSFEIEVKNHIGEVKARIPGNTKIFQSLYIILVIFKIYFIFFY